ncbi:hypothetical protein [Pseudomonas shahriarae]
MTDYTELKRLATRIVEVQTSQDVPISKLFDDFEAAACPETILALIAENKRLTGCIVQRRAQAEQYDQALIKMAAERDRLRAEVAGLRTGYEAYEQVNAELKAEVERSEQHRNDQQDSIVALRIELASLRKDADRYRWLLQNWFTMSSEYMGGVSFQTGRSRWSDLPDEAVSEAIDAALGQGEQS